MNSWLLERTAMPLVSKLTQSRFWDLYREMLASECVPLGSRLERQGQRLRRILEHAYSHVPVYRELFDAAGVRPVESGRRRIWLVSRSSPSRSSSATFRIG